MAFGGSYNQTMTDETFDFICTNCSIDKKLAEAVKYCTECSVYFCQPCIVAHNNLSFLKNHKLLDVVQGNQATGQSSNLIEFPVERCRLHAGKVVDMYCEDHDVVGCSDCMKTDHRFCQDSRIHSVPGKINTLFKRDDCKHVHDGLKDMMVTMDTVEKSNDDVLQMLKKSKQNALEEVSTFQKDQETMIRQKADISRNKIDAEYKILEKEIVDRRAGIKNVKDHMKSIDDKLEKSYENRAQAFVCSKLGQELITEANSVKTQQELSKNVNISLVADKNLKDYIKALQGIGDVITSKTQKSDGKMYKIIGRKDIPIKESDDSNVCWSNGCCLINDNQLLVTDCLNSKLKRIDIQKMAVVDHCILDAAPYGVCCINQYEAAVACENNIIQFVSVKERMTSRRKVKVSHYCYGIACNQDKLYVTGGKDSLYIHDMSGTLLKTIKHDNDGNQLFYDSAHVTFNESGDRLYVGGGDKGLVCFDGSMNYLSTITDPDMEFVIGAMPDERGGMFIAGRGSNNVVQYSENGKKIGQLIGPKDGLENPRSVCFHQGLNMLFVTMDYSNIVKMYQLQ